MPNLTFGQFLGKLRNDSRDEYGDTISLDRLAALICKSRGLDESSYGSYSARIQRWETDTNLPHVQRDRADLVALLKVLRMSGGISTPEVANQLLDKGRYARLDAEESRTVFGPQIDTLPSDPRSRIPIYTAPSEVYGYLYRRREEEYEERYELRRDRIVIGRNENQVDLVIPLAFSFVGGIHAALTRTSSGVWIEDLASRNGTYLNGQKIVKPVPLSPGQRVLLGGSASSPKVCVLEYSLDPLIPTDSPDTQ